MSVNLKQFVRSLTDSGILSADEIAAVKGALSDHALGDAVSIDASEFPAVDSPPAAQGNDVLALIDPTMFLASTDARELDRTVELGADGATHMLTPAPSKRGSSVFQETSAGVAQLAKQLVDRATLTAFQAERVYQGAAQSLLFGDYVILDEIGAGGMGRVVKARHRTTDRVVALKILGQTATQSPELVKRFHREVKATARLNHPNIVTAFEDGEVDGVYFFAMEYVDGRDFRTLVERDGLPPVAKAVDCILQAARGLQYAHERGAIHRDVKPGNLLLDSQGIVKILDMGLVRFSEDETEIAVTYDERLTLPGQILGTPEYMSPEQADDTHETDGRADIYSLGCTLHFLLTGNAPYTGDSVVTILLGHASKPIPSLCTARDDVPDQLDAVFKTMLAKEPDDRQQSMSELIDQLESL